MEAKRQKERSALGWVMTFAGTHRGLYAVSVAVAAVVVEVMAVALVVGVALAVIGKNFLKNFLNKCEKSGDFEAYIVKDKIPSPDNSDLEN